MLLVDSFPIASAERQSKGNEILPLLLDHPTLISTSCRLKATPEKAVAFSQDSPPFKHVYVFQGEYATVHPSLIEFVGTDEATTCVGLVIRNPSTKITSISHMDHERVVDMGLSQMLAFVVDNNVDATLDVHLIGSFEDVPYEPRRHLNYSGYSVPLCSKIIEALQNRQEKFQVQTFCVLSHNTKKDLNGSSMPIITGFLVETSTGTIMPACFNKSTRCPDEIVRRIRISVSREDPCWEMKLLETYDTFLDRFVIAPCSWMLEWENRALSLQQLSDSKILKLCSTSPTAEAPDFVENLRRVWNYLMRYPHWEQSFTGRKPRIFERTITGGWSRCK